MDRVRGREYPNSLMGAIALIRQTLLDAQWYKAAHDAYENSPAGKTRPEENLALASLVDVTQGSQPVMIEVSDELNFLRALKIVNEFGLRSTIFGNGYEYRQLNEVKAAGVPVVLPVNFPEAPKVENPEEALSVGLEQLSHWELAPENPKRLNEAGVAFAFTSAKLKKADQFHAKVRETVERGLSADAALAALTTGPARMLGMTTRLGSIEKNKLANLVAADGDLFGKKTKIMDTWVRGVRYEVEAKPEVDPRGKWDATFTLAEGTETGTLEISGEVKKLKGKLTADEKEISLKSASLDYRRITIVFPGDSIGIKGMVRMSGKADKERLAGRGELPDGGTFTWNATRKKEEMAEKKKKMKPTAKTESTAAAMALGYPAGAYGRTAPPEQPKTIFVKGATIWTSGPAGILEDSDMMITQGKITAIGQGLEAPSGALVIDAGGKHVTAGLIDAHSHTAISSGVNEGSQAVTSEVSVEDVINSKDMYIYRQLAGGLTAINQLHGSANPIGGKNSVIKLRWGSSPEGLRFKEALPGIKFALGENVKRSNWNDPTRRYPQTRMGVDQIIRDRFRAAMEYEQAWSKYNSKRNKKGVIPPRRDLELETLVEIMNSKRFVHSHSYRQDEILMLMRIAEDFGFRIKVFQHVLEGYKIAEAMKEHGAMASAFSDWWAYKYEVIDAIPYNGALMHDVGVVVTYNSDSGELARRMNLEAAKAVKYGGVDPAEALKFVTLNSAIQLGVEKYVGSLEEGKHGDFVIWSGSPLSTYSKCEQTWIEGRKYFDIEEDKKMRTQVMAERARLIQKVMASASKDKPKGPASGMRGRPTENSSETMLRQEVER
jgi:imidazolonepropionase-like amidohydrolase